MFQSRRRRRNHTLKKKQSSNASVLEQRLRTVRQLTIVILINRQTCRDQDGSTDWSDRQDVFPVSVDCMRMLVDRQSKDAKISKALTLPGDRT